MLRKPASSHLIPIFSGPRLLDRVDEQRAKRISLAPNATVEWGVIRDKRSKTKRSAILAIHLADLGADKPLAFHRGNPRRYSHDHENHLNPPRCWTLRHLPSADAPIYRSVVTSCIQGGA